MSNSVACTHCHLEFDESILIKEDEFFFCCKGCQGVFHLLNDQGLESFYDKAGTTPLSPPINQYEDSSNFDVESFYDKFVKVNSEGLNEVSLIIEGIHCSACVWLNEKALQKMPGVIEATINFTNNKAHIVWSDDVLKLSAIIDMIRAIGYNAFAYDSSTVEVHANAKRKEYYLRLIVAIFASMNIMMIAVAQYAGFFTGMKQEMKTIFNIAEGILATPVLFYSGWIFFRGAYYGIKNKIVNMDILVATGALLTYIFSIYITVLEVGEAYFDSVSMIITFVLIGKFLEILSKKSAADTLDIIGKQVPSEVKIIKNEKIIFCKLTDVQIGDTVVLSSGEKAFLDGIITDGKGSFDESSLSGESRAIFKDLNDTVISGTTSIDADIHYKATKDFEHSTLSSLVSLLESAINKKPKIEQLANKLSEYFSTIILLFAFITFFTWWLWPHSFELAFMVGISVIVIACPCALALATPVATLVGLSLGAKRGILFKEAAQLETMAKVTTVVLDKTGTITQGKPSVLKETIYKDFDKNILYSLVKRSSHPISKAMAEYMAINENIDEYILDEYVQIPASGISAKYKDKRILGGNLTLVQNYELNANYVSDNSVFYVVIDTQLVAVYELSDKLKDHAVELVSKLKKRNFEVVMLTGDNENIASIVASEVGISIVESEQTPEDKLKYIENLHKENKVVIMVGDGVNDILALAQSDIGIVMGSGSDIAVDVGDVVLLDDSLKSLEDAFKISSTTFTLIKQNLSISLVYNAITIPLAMAGYVIPLVAAISMSISSLLVVGNSMRIQYKWKKN